MIYVYVTNGDEGRRTTAALWKSDEERVSPTFVEVQEAVEVLERARTGGSVSLAERARAIDVVFEIIEEANDVCLGNIDGTTPKLP